MLKLQPKLEVVQEKPESGPETKDSFQNATQENQLDTIIVQIGQFGRFQISNYLLLCLPIICNALYSISYVFTAGQVPHRWVINPKDLNGPRLRGDGSTPLFQMQHYPVRQLGDQLRRALPQLHHPASPRNLGSVRALRCDS